jgi:chemotaxis protein CheZ
MPALEVATKARDALAAPKGAELVNPRLGEALNLTLQMSEAMQMSFASIDKSLFDEIRYISSFIQHTRLEISHLRPNNLTEDRIPGAGAELHAVVHQTAEATNLIMAVAEDVIAADSSDPVAYNAFVTKKMMELFEACTFQDMTGQRIRKVVDTLTHIEQRLERFANMMGVEDGELDETFEDKRKRENLLNGPALNGPEVAQDDIDALFNTQIASLGQGDSDALFGGI